MSIGLEHGQGKQRKTKVTYYYVTTIYIMICTQAVCRQIWGPYSQNPSLFGLQLRLEIST